jgi:hypothetical protein
MMARDKIKKVVLAYSGGLDTSVILKWLQTTYGCEVVTFTADLGQGEEVEPARKKAQLAGAKEIFVEDLREEFVRDFVFPMFRANALYEGAYLLEGVTGSGKGWSRSRSKRLRRRTGPIESCNHTVCGGSDDIGQGGKRSGSNEVADREGRNFSTAI